MHPIPPESSRISDIYLLIAQYPMLASRIRRQMRQELFRRGIITPERFEQEVREKAVLSQQREGFQAPFQKEDAAQWDLRFHRVQRTLTDFYFAYELKSSRAKLLKLKLLDKTVQISIIIVC